MGEAKPQETACTADSLSPGQRFPHGALKEKRRPRRPATKLALHDVAILQHVYGGWLFPRHDLLLHDLLLLLFGNDGLDLSSFLASTPEPRTPGGLMRWDVSFFGCQVRFDGSMICFALQVFVEWFIDVYSWPNCLESKLAKRSRHSAP